MPDPWLDYREQRARERRQAAEHEQALRLADEDDEPDPAGISASTAAALGVLTCGRTPGERRRA
ncbi:MAG TPA: hypothetical protein VF933_14015 [Streptosporangiaceae bacterium]